MKKLWQPAASMIMPEPARLRSAADLLLHLAPLDSETTAALGEQARQAYLRDLNRELGEIEERCHSTALDGLVAEIEARVRDHRKHDPSWERSDREFEEREGLSALIVWYAALQASIKEARAEVGAGKVPSLIGRIRTLAAYVDYLRLLYSERELNHRLEAENSRVHKRKHSVSRTAEIKKSMQSYLDNGSSYDEACEKVSQEREISKSRVRKLARKCDLIKLT
jgi:hypothetical protein